MLKRLKLHISILVSILVVAFSIMAITNAVSQDDFISESGEDEIVGVFFTMSPLNPDIVNPIIGNASGRPGDEVTIDVFIDNVHSNGLLECGFDLFFSSSELEVIDVVPSNLIQNPEENFNSVINSSSVNLVYKDTTNGTELIIQENSNPIQFAQIVFKIRDYAYNGEKNISVRNLYCKVPEYEYGGDEFIRDNHNEYSSKGVIIVHDAISSKVEIDVEIVSGLPGEVVEIPVSFSSLERQITSFTFALAYLPEYLEIMSIDIGEVLGNPDGFKYTSDTAHLGHDCIVLHYYEHGSSGFGNGEVAVITARIKPEVTSMDFLPIYFIDPLIPYYSSIFDPKYLPPTPIPWPQHMGSPPPSPPATRGMTSIIPYYMEVVAGKFGGVWIKNNVVLGDLNGDGVINSIDCVLLKRYMLGIINKFPKDIDLSSADLNGDHVIDSSDYILLKRYLLGLIAKFPINTLIPTPTPPAGVWHWWWGPAPDWWTGPIDPGTPIATPTPIPTPTATPTPPPPAGVWHWWWGPAPDWWTGPIDAGTPTATPTPTPTVAPTATPTPPPPAIR